MRLKTLIRIAEWISHAPTVNRNPDDRLRAMPGGLNDNNPNFDDNTWDSGHDSWDSIVEGKDWFCYIESNDWQNKKAGATVYINEGDTSHKIWIKIKSHGLKKPTDTNRSFQERVRKHINKIAKSWVSEAKKIHNNPEINEVGNPVPVSWKQAFQEAIKSPKITGYVSDKGEASGVIADPVNFTPRK
jgi:hypothetical protein